MPIGGVVITVYPDDRQETEITLGRFADLSVYGSDEKGNIIAVLKGDNPESIKELILEIERVDTVLNVNLAYLKADDGSGSLAKDG